MKKFNTRKIVLTAMFSAIASVLMLLEFPIAFLLPSYLKFDFSDVATLIATFAMGPVSGIIVCFIKNLINLLLDSTTGGIGELCNFLLSVAFILPAGLMYKRKRKMKSAVLGMGIGVIATGIASIVVNFFIIYPVYAKIMTTSKVDGMTILIGMYKAFLPWVNDLLTGILVFNLPFTLIRCIICAVITLFLYKRLSPLIRKGD